MRFATVESHSLWRSKWPLYTGLATFGRWLAGCRPGIVLDQIGPK